MCNFLFQVLLDLKEAVRAWDHCEVLCCCGLWPEDYGFGCKLNRFLAGWVSLLQPGFIVIDNVLRQFYLCIVMRKGLQESKEMNGTVSLL